MQLVHARLTTLMLLITFIFQQVRSQPVPVLGFTPVATSGLAAPVDIVAEPGSPRLFIVQQGGTIRIFNGSSVLATPFLTIPSPNPLSTGGERGLLSMAFHPDYLTNRYFFVYYTNTTGDITVSRYRRDPVDANIADPLTPRVDIINIPKPSSNHNGGKMNFGSDGMLYFATGDGGGGNDPFNNAQNGTSLLGKMLRLNVNSFATSFPFYDIPPDNPFVGASPIADEIFALGLRNPWRWSFDRSNGDMWIADVGQDNREEVNHLSFANSDGVNYGWSCFEGTRTNTEAVSQPCVLTGGSSQAPVFEYNHSLGRSITGGYVYQGINPTNAPLRGYYICADYISGRVWLVRPDGSSRLQTGLPGNISGFGEDNTGELFAVSPSSNTLYSVVVTGVLPVRLLNFSGAAFAGYNELKWTTASEENTQKFVVEYSTNGTNFLSAGELSSSLNSTGGSYSFRHAITSTGALQYRLRIVDIDQSAQYSAVISISRKGDKEIRIYPTLITGNLLQVVSGRAVEKIEIFNLDGKQMLTKYMNGTRGYFTMPLPLLQKGLYLVRVTGRDFQKTERIVVN